jgi:hypothetical protein
MVIDTDAGRCTWYRTTYDVGAVQDAMRDAGLPDRLVQRLSYGL